MDGYLGNEFGNMLRSKELTTRLPRVGGVVADQIFVGIPEEVDLVVFKVSKVEVVHPFQYGSKAGVLVFDRPPQAVARGVEIIKQPFDVLFRGVTHGRALNSGEDRLEIRIKIFVVIRLGDDIGKELAGVDEVALGLDGIIFDLIRNDVIVQLGVVDAFVSTFNVASEILTDETVEKRAKHILLEVPSVHRAAHVIGNLPDASF